MMRVIVAGAIAWAVGCHVAVAQTANFKCAKEGTVVEFSDSSRTTVKAPGAGYCQHLVKPPNAEERLNNWYAPTVSLNAAGTQTFADQIKPQILWPLAVGKKLTGSYNGPGFTASYQGTWHEVIIVEGYEKLTTKAGSFDTFVVTRTEEALSHKYRSTLKQWYAPEPGIIVKFDFSDNQGYRRAGEAVSVRQ